MILGGRDELVAREHHLEAAAEAYEPTLSSYLYAKMASGFEYTTTKQGLLSTQIDSAPDNNTPISKEEFEAKYARPGIDYQDDMSLAKARIYAEEWDARAYRQQIIDSSKPGFAGSVAGFGAMLLGNLPDPVNLIPFGGGLVKGGKVVSRVGKGATKLFVGEDLLAAGSKGALLETGARESVKAAFKPTAKSIISMGAAEGAMGAAAADAIALPYLAERGEDVGLADALLDVAFGAIIGGALHYGGYKLGEKIDKNFGHAESRTIKGVRGITTIEDKKIVLAAHDLSVQDFIEKGQVDVGAVLENTSTIHNLDYNKLILALEKEDYVDVNFGTLRQDYKEALNSVRLEEGVQLIVGNDLIIPGNVVKKLHEKRILQDGYSADEVARLLLDIFHKEGNNVYSSRYPHIQAIAQVREELTKIGFIGVDPKNGKTIIKSGYKISSKKLENSLGKKQPLRKDARIPSSRALDGSRQPGRFTDHRSGSDKNIVHINREVNFSKETPEVFPEAPILSKEARNALDEAGIDPATKMSPEEAQIEALREQGALSPDEMEELEFAKNLEKSVEVKEEAGLTVLPCVLGVKK